MAHFENSSRIGTNESRTTVIVEEGMALNLEKLNATGPYPSPETKLIHAAMDSRSDIRSERQCKFTRSAIYVHSFAYGEQNLIYDRTEEVAVLRK